MAAVTTSTSGLPALSFAAGPFFAAITYDKFDIPGASSDQSNLTLGATFDLKIVKLHAGYSKESDQRFFNVLGITSGADADSFMAGLTFPLFGGSLFGSWQKYDGDRVQLTPTTFDERDAKVYGIGYTYPLSRRTNIYAAFARNNAEESINNTALDRRQYAIGIRHLF